MKKDIKVKRLVPPVQAKMGDTNYALFNPIAFTRIRAVDIVQNVVAERTRVLPNTIRDGELERFFLDPLIKEAQTILSTPPGADGQLLSVWMNKAQRLGVTATVLNSAGNKLQVEAIGEIIREKSPLFSIMKPEDSDPAQKLNEQIKSRLSDFLSGSKFSTPQINDLLSQIPGHTPTLRMTAADLDAEDLAKSLFTYAGVGAGVPLLPQQVEFQKRKLHIIEWALYALLNPKSVWPNDNAEPRYLDAYSLAIAYLTYLHYAIDPDKYQLLFPTSPKSDPTQIAITRAVTTARRTASYWALITSAAVSADLLMINQMMHTYFNFMEKLIPLQLTAIDDAKRDLQYSTDQLNSIVPAPIKAHHETLMKQYSLITGHDINALLPVAVQDHLGINLASVPKFSQVKMGDSITDLEGVATSWVDPLHFGPLYAQIRIAASALRQYTDTSLMTLANFYTAFSEFDVNAVGLPSDLFDIKRDITPINQLVYASPFRYQDFCAAIPKYVKGPGQNNNTFSWSLKKYVNAIVPSISLRTKLLEDNAADRYTFPKHDISIPIGSSIVRDYAYQLIPHDMVSYGWYPHVSYTIKEYLQFMLTRNPDTSIFATPLHHAAYMMSVDAIAKKDLVNYLAATMRVYVRTSAPDAPEKWELQMPTIPTIYGVPTSVFINKQQSISDSDLAKIQPSEFVREIPDAAVALKPMIRVSSKQFAPMIVVLHDKYPAPGPCSQVSADIAMNAMMQVPMRSAYYESFIKVAVSNASSIASGRGVSIDAFKRYLQDEATVGDVRDATLKWFTPKSWASVVCPLPHLLFKVQEAYSADNSIFGIDINKSLETFRIQAQYTGGPMFAISEFDPKYVIIEEEDFDAIPSSDDNAFDAVIAIDLNINDSPAPQTQTPTQTVVEQSMETSSPTMESESDQAKAAHDIISTAATAPLPKTSVETTIDTNTKIEAKAGLEEAQTMSEEEKAKKKKAMVDKGQTPLSGEITEA